MEEDMALEQNAYVPHTEESGADGIAGIGLLSSSAIAETPSDSSTETES